MQKRRIQEIGKSLFISLPKKWVDQMQLKKGDLVTLVSQQNRAITIYPEEKEKKPRQIELNINKASKQSIRRRITGAFVDGFDIIQVKSRNPFTEEQQDKIRDIAEEMFGLEVIHVESHKITIECLLKPTLPIDNTINRIHNIVQSMFSETILAFQRHDIKLAESVPRKVREIEKLSTVIHRALRSLILYPTLALRVELSLIDSVDFLNVLNRMRGVAYNITNLSESIAKINPIDLPKAVLNPLSENFKLTQDLYVKAIQSLNTKDMHLSDYVLDTRPDYEKLWTLCLKANENTEITSFTFSYIHRMIDNLTQIWQHIREIAEITIDRAETEIKRSTAEN